MDKRETALLIQTIITMVPGSKLTADELTVSIWQEMLSDLPGELAMLAAKRVCAEKCFAPSIAEIRGAVAQAVMEREGALSAGEAWAKVKKAIGDYGYIRPEKAREALGEEIWRAVEMTGGWTELCMSEAGSAVLSAQFARRYEAALAQRREKVLIPQRLREEMKRLAAPMCASLRLEQAAPSALIEAGEG